MSKPFMIVDVEIRSNEVPEELVEAVKKSIAMILQVHKQAIPYLSYDIQDFKD